MINPENLIGLLNRKIFISIKINFLGSYIKINKNHLVIFLSTLIKWLIKQK